MDKVDKQKLIEWLNNLKGSVYVHDIINAITLGRFDIQEEQTDEST